MADEHSEALAGLRIQLQALQERVREMEEERRALASQHRSFNQQHLDRITALEKVKYLIYSDHLLRHIEGPI